MAGGIVEVSAMQYIPSGTTGVTYFILLNTYNDGGPARIVTNCETIIYRHVSALPIRPLHFQPFS